MCLFFYALDRVLSLRRRIDVTTLAKLTTLSLFSAVPRRYKQEDWMRNIAIFSSKWRLYGRLVYEHTDEYDGKYGDQEHAPPHPEITRINGGTRFCHDSGRIRWYNID